MKYLLFNRDPYNGFWDSPHTWVVFMPYITLDNQGPFFIAQIDIDLLSRHPKQQKNTAFLKESVHYMGVSENRGTPKSSILIGFSIINHRFWGTPIFGNTHIHSTKIIPTSGSPRPSEPKPPSLLVVSHSQLVVFVSLKQCGKTPPPTFWLGSIPIPRLSDNNKRSSLPRSSTQLSSDTSLPLAEA